MSGKHPGQDEAVAGRFEEAASRLLSIIALSAKIDDTVDPDSCALSRVPRIDGGLTLSSRAIALGFTYEEAWGIMSGWDSERDGCLVLWMLESNPHWATSPGYLRGIELGRLAWEVRP